MSDARSLGVRARAHAPDLRDVRDARGGGGGDLSAAAPRNGTGASRLWLEGRRADENGAFSASHDGARRVRDTARPAPSTATSHGGGGRAVSTARRQLAGRNGAGSTKRARLRIGIEHQVEIGPVVGADHACEALLAALRASRGSAPGERTSESRRRVEGLAAQHRVRPAKGEHARDEADDLVVPLPERPVDPARLVVLAVGVVVAALRAAELVARRGASARRARRPGSAGSS